MARQFKFDACVPVSPELGVVPVSLVEQHFATGVAKLSDLCTLSNAVSREDQAEQAVNFLDLFLPVFF